MTPPAANRTPAGRTIDDRVQVTLRLPAFLHAKLCAIAKADRRPLNTWIIVQLEAAAKREPPP